MNSSRPRSSVEAARKPRHAPRIQMDTVPTSYGHHVSSDMTHASIASMSGSPDFYHEVGSWDSFLSGIDSNHIPALSVAPTDLTNVPYWQSMDTRYSLDSSSISSAAPTKTCISPPMTEAEMMHADMLQSPLDSFGYWPERWGSTAMPLTPPAEDYDMELFNDKIDPLDLPLAEPTSECIYLGPSKLQFSSAPMKHTQPRPIRSASERSPLSTSSGSPYSRLAKDDHSERVKHNPRNDPRYEEKADKDGYYHCPYVREGCNHKPTKQKCIYAKNLDSHLKPYICRYGATEEGCRSLRFSSNACLFRHEREMHGLHNHGINPYLCKFPGCERARHDNGFPRRWNQRDHMKRVHGWEEIDSDDSADRRHADPSARRKKSSGSSHNVPMKRTGSSRAPNAYYPGVPRTVSAPRQAGQATRGLQARNSMITGMNPQEVSYAPQHMMNQAYAHYTQSVY